MEPTILDRNLPTLKILINLLSLPMEAEDKLNYLESIDIPRNEKRNWIIGDEVEEEGNREEEFTGESQEEGPTSVRLK